MKKASFKMLFLKVLLFLLLRIKFCFGFSNVIRTSIPLNPCMFRSQFTSNGKINRFELKQNVIIEDVNEEHEFHRRKEVWFNKSREKFISWRSIWKKRIRNNCKVVNSFLFALLLFAAPFVGKRNGCEILDTGSRVGVGIERVMPSTCSRKALLSSGGSTNVRIKNMLSREKELVNNDVVQATKNTFTEAWTDFLTSLHGPKFDALLLLAATALIPAMCQKLSISPILGFLASGMLLGPNGFGMINEIHTTESLAELGIVFFLFEMGIELSVERLSSMKRDVFGLGLSQFLITTLFLVLVGLCTTSLSGSALVVVGAGLALSSSAFVLQLLKDKDEMSTRFGKASFGILLLQDLAVVPLLVLTPILAGNGKTIMGAVSNAVFKASIALSSIFAMGHFILDPLFRVVASSRSQEAFLGVVLLTVLGMGFLTEGLGLSSTLGAFLAGVLLSETKYRYQIEADIAPFRAILLGFFFVTVGFEIDLAIIASNKVLVSTLVLGILSSKALITTLLGNRLFGLSLSTSQQTGLILSQAGEFAFVTFGLARNLGLLTPYQTKILLTVVAITMALTPSLKDLSSKIASNLEEKSDITHYLAEDNDCVDIKQSGQDFVVVIGYGIVGKIVCDLLSQKFINFIGLEINPEKAIQARNKGLPVYYGDVARPEVAEAFKIGQAKAIISTIKDKDETNRAIISLRRKYPKTKIFARATDSKHAKRLNKYLDVIAMVPTLPEDHALLVLPFGGAVLKSLGADEVEVNAILETKRTELLMGRGSIDVSLTQLQEVQMVPPKTTIKGDTNDVLDVSEVPQAPQVDVNDKSLLIQNNATNYTTVDAVTDIVCELENAYGMNISSTKS